MISASVTLTSAAPKRNLASLLGLGAAQAVPRCYIITSAAIRCGDTNITTNSGFPLSPFQVNLFEFSAADVAGDNFFLVRDNTGPDIVVHIMASAP